MKVTTVILCVLLSHASASFFDEFNSAISSVEDSVGKLFTDVVTDVRTTLGCTILAVKKALAMGGTFHESSDYDERCGGQSNAGASSVQESLDSYSPSPPILTATPSSHSVRSEKSLSKRMSEEVNVSVEKVKDKMLGIIENHDTHKRIKQVTKRLKNTTDRLSEIGVILHSELDNLTDDVKKGLSKMKIDYIHPTLDNLWKDVKILHDIESKETNPHDAAEIRHILNEILKVLSPSNDQDDSLANESGKSESDKIFTLINDEFKSMKHKNDSKGIESIVHALDIQNGNNTLEKQINQDIGVSDLPLTFQEVAKKIMNETKNELSDRDQSVVVNGPTLEYKSGSVDNTVASVNTEKTTTNENGDLPDYYDAFLIIPKDSRSRKAAALETKKLVEQSKQAEKIMSSFFQESDTMGTSIFDSSDLFVF